MKPTLEHKVISVPETSLPSEVELVEVSVVIPVFNEEERIIDTITQLDEYLRRQEIKYEVIISDDGSRDESPGLVRERFAGRASVRLIQDERNRGKGAAVRRGVLAARGRNIIFTDA